MPLYECPECGEILDRRDRTDSIPTFCSKTGKDTRAKWVDS